MRAQPEQPNQGMSQSRSPPLYAVAHLMLTPRHPGACAFGNTHLGCPERPGAIAPVTAALLPLACCLELLANANQANQGFQAPKTSNSRA
jgi:hypothetical protein